MAKKVIFSAPQGDADFQIVYDNKDEGGDNLSVDLIQNKQAPFSFWKKTTKIFSILENGIVEFYGQIKIGNTLLKFLGTALRTITFPDKDGTVAMLSDIAGGGGLITEEVTVTTKQLAVNTRYIMNNASRISATLPTLFAISDVIEIIGKGSGGWRINRNAGQTVEIGNTITGTTDIFASVENNCIITLKTLIANTKMTCQIEQGNISITPFNQFSLSYDGVNQRVDMGNITALELQEFTFCAFVKRNAIGSRHVIFSCQEQLNSADGICGWFLEIDDTNKLRLVIVINNTFEVFTTVSTYTSTTTWLNVILIKTGTTIEIYADNILVLTGVLSSATIDYSTITTKKTTIGATWGNTSGFILPLNGKIDEIYLWNKGFSSIERGEIYNSGKPRDISALATNTNLVFWSRGGDAAAFVSGNWELPDESVNNFTGTSANMTETNRTTDVP